MTLLSSMDIQYSGVIDPLFPCLVMPDLAALMMLFSRSATTKGDGERETTRSLRKGLVVLEPRSWSINPRFRIGKIKFLRGRPSVEIENPWYLTSSRPLKTRLQRGYAGFRQCSVLYAVVVGRMSGHIKRSTQNHFRWTHILRSHRWGTRQTVAVVEFPPHLPCILCMLANECRTSFLLSALSILPCCLV